MKFTCSVIINAPKEKVVEYFSEPQYLHEWQEGYLGMKHISGVPSQSGSKTEMRYKFGKGEMVITETILNNNLPHDFKGNYHHKHTENTMLNIFKAIDDQTTSYKAEIEYTRFSGIMINIMKTIMPGMFKKQVQKWMDNFKTFVENQ